MIHTTWVVEHPEECYVDYKTSTEAHEAYDSIELRNGEYKYLFMAFDSECGASGLDDIGLKYESKEEA